MTPLRLTWLLLRKDLAIAARTREVPGLMLEFALLCVVVFAFGFLREGAPSAVHVPGVLWVTLLFSSTVGLLRLFSAEEEAGALDWMVRTVAGGRPLYWSKALLQFMFSALVTALLLPLVAVFFDARLLGLPWVALALALGLCGQALMGALVAAWMAQARMREVLLPLVLYPLLAPLLLAGVKLTALAMAGAPSSAWMGWLELLLAFDAVAVVVCPWLFDRVVT